MEVGYASQRLANTCASSKKLIREFGQVRAKRIMVRLQQLRVADTLADLRLVTTRVHELTGDLKGSIALDLDGPFRLLFEPVDWITNEQGGLDWSAVDSVVVTQVIDYH